MTLEPEKQFCKSVLFLLKERNLPIGEFEDQIGVSRGYLSRQAHDGNIRLSDAISIADRFHITIDDILRFDESYFIRKKKQEKIDELKAQIARLEAEMNE